MNELLRNFSSELATVFPDTTQKNPQNAKNIENLMMSLNFLQAYRATEWKNFAGYTTIYSSEKKLCVK